MSNNFMKLRYFDMISGDVVICFEGHLGDNVLTRLSCVVFCCDSVNTYGFSSCPSSES